MGVGVDTRSDTKVLATNGSKPAVSSNGSVDPATDPAGVPQRHRSKPPADVAARTAEWILTKSPDDLLELFLDRYFDLPIKYTRPVELDWTVRDLPELADASAEVGDIGSAG